MVELDKLNVLARRCVEADVDAVLKRHCVSVDFLAVEVVYPRDLGVGAFVFHSCEAIYTFNSADSAVTEGCALSGSPNDPL